MFLRVLEILVVALIIFQVIVPYMFGKKAFPMFRREGAILRKISEKRQHSVETVLAKELGKSKRS